MHIGKRLKELRNVRGMTQAKVSEDITSAPHYSNIEGGHFATSQDILVLLAKKLAVPIVYLTNGHVIDKEMTGLLKQYEDILNEGRLDEALSFRETHEKNFQYIPSLNQELYFKLLRCLELFKVDEYEAFGKYYRDKILPIIDHDTLDDLIPPIQEKYVYISGLYHYMNKNYKDSIQFFDSVLKMNENPSLSARLSFNIALAYFRIHNYTKSFKYARESKDYYLNLNNWEKTAECYNLIGVLYKLKGDFVESEIFLYKGLHILGDGHNRIKTKLLHNLALIHKDKGQHNVALEVINNCLFLKEKYDSGDLFISYRAKLNILLDLKDENSLVKNIELTRTTCKSQSDKFHLKVIEGKLYLLQSHYSNYEKYIQECIDYYFEHERWKCLNDIAEELSEYYAERKQYKKAFVLNKKCLIATQNIYKEML